MKRDRVTKMLERICQQIDRGECPVPITGLWVFGSYARGAEEPGDLDIVVAHGEAAEAMTKKWKREARRKARNFVDSLFYVDRRRDALIRTALRRPGENIDILLGPSIMEVEKRFSLIRRGPRIPLWSPVDRDWRSKLAEIRPNPRARSSDHGLFMKPQPAGCDLRSMQHLTEMLREKVIIASRAELGEAPATMSTWPKDALYSLGVALEYGGRKRRECLPFAFQWIIDQGATGRLSGCDDDVRSQDRRYQVGIGKLYPHWITRTLCKGEQVEAFAHILHFKRGMPREILVFRRGPRWKERDAIERALQVSGFKKAA